MSKQKRYPFHLVLGGQDIAFNSALKGSRRPVQQLDLWESSLRPQTVLPVGMRDIYWSEFCGLLRRFHVQSVCDIRASTAFLGRGFDRDNFFDTLEQWHVSYRHFFELSNQFVGRFPDSSEEHDAYLEQLLEHRDVLSELRSLIDRGPVILLDAFGHGGDSDRQVVLEALFHIRGGFIVHALKH